MRILTVVSVLVASLITPSAMAGGIGSVEKRAPRITEKKIAMPRDRQALIGYKARTSAPTGFHDWIGD